MDYINKIFYHLFQYFNIKTLRFNLKYFPLSQAILLPVYISRKTWLNCLKGSIKINGRIKPGMITIGFGDVGIFDKKMSRSILQIKGKIIFNGSAVFGHGAKISVYEGGILTFGKNTQLTAESALVCEREIIFGNDCLLSWDILIMDSDSHRIYELDQKVANYPKPILIGDNVWIGCRVTILKGVIIPNGCVIGSGSVVTKRFCNNNTLISGNPASERRTIHHWSRENFAFFDFTDMSAGV